MSSEQGCVVHWVAETACGNRLREWTTKEGLDTGLVLCLEVWVVALGRACGGLRAHIAKVDRGRWRQLYVRVTKILRKYHIWSTAARVCRGVSGVWKSPKGEKGRLLRGGCTEEGTCKRLVTEARKQGGRYRTLVVAEDLLVAEHLVVTEEFDERVFGDDTCCRQ